MLLLLLGAARVNNADVRRHDNVGRARISASDCCRRTTATGHSRSAPARLRAAFSSRIFTAGIVSAKSFSQISETSSSVGPMPLGLLGASDSGMYPALSSSVAGEEPVFNYGIVEVGIDWRLAMLRGNHQQRAVIQSLGLQLGDKLPNRSIDKLDLAKQCFRRCSRRIQVATRSVVALLVQLLALR